MENPEYALHLSGKILDGYERSGVVERLAQLFKCPCDKAEKLLSGKPVCLKRALTEEAAHAYKSRLKSIGLDVFVEAPPAAEPDFNLFTEPDGSAPVAPLAQPQASQTEVGLQLTPAEPPLAEKSTSGTPAAATGNPTMVCPKCGVRQDKHDICQHCGVVIAKVQQRAPASLPHETTEDADEHDLMRDLAFFVGENYAEKYQSPFVELNNSGKSFAMHWHWPAFFFPFSWFFYRKLYLWAGGVVVLLVIGPYYLKFLLSVAAALTAYSLYYQHGVKTTAAIGTTGDERGHALAGAGGTNSLVITVIVTITVGILIAWLQWMLWFNEVTDEFEGKIMQNQAIVESASDRETAERLLVLQAGVGFGLLGLRMRDENAALPADNESLYASMGMQASDFLDRWENEILYSLDGGQFVLQSAGPDGSYDTDDDIMLTGQAPS